MAAAEPVGVAVLLNVTADFEGVPLLLAVAEDVEEGQGNQLFVGVALPDLEAVPVDEPVDSAVADGVAVPLGEPVESAVEEGVAESVAEAEEVRESADNVGEVEVVAVAVGEARGE